MAEVFADMGAQLPAEVLDVLPREAHLQLELAHSIACHAYLQKVSTLEAEAEQLQSSLMQSQQTVKSLERRLSGMETELLEHQQRARQCLTEQHKLAAEKSALIETVKRLNREVARLEHFKRNLLQTLQEDSEADGSAALSSTFAAVDLTTERLVSEVLHSADGIAAAAAAAAAAAGHSGGGSQYQQQQQHQQQQQQQQRQSPGAASYAGGGAWSPPRPGKLAAGAGSPAGASGTYVGSSAKPGGAGAGAAAAAGGYRQLRSASSPGKEAVLGSKAGIPAAGGGSGDSSGVAPAAARSLAAAGAAAAAAPRFASPPQHSGRAPPLPSSAAAAAAAAAGRVGGSMAAATSPRIDGKEFFKQARARLSYEQFASFLSSIKDLNAGRASREDTLDDARRLFGPGNADLYGLFEGLLMRHLTAL